MISRDIFKYFNLNMTERLENVFRYHIKVGKFGFLPAFQQTTASQHDGNFLTIPFNQ